MNDVNNGNNNSSLWQTAGTDIKKLTPAEFAELVSFGRWKHAPHLDCIDNLMSLLCRGDIKKLMLNMPPRHGKSEFISKYFVAWHLLRYPEKRIILTSYSNSFAETWGRKVREIIDEFGPEMFGIEIKKNIRSTKSFELSGFEGGLHCAGAGSSLTGRGADLLIIDDPVKNGAEAMSKAVREKIYDWYKSTALSRLEPSGATILVMTRWHTGDLAGKITEDSDIITYSDFIADEQKTLKDEQWVILSLPALAAENDPIGRETGAPLWPERYGRDSLLSISGQLGSFWFNALYQQNPLPEGDALFKRMYFKYFYEDDEYYFLESRFSGKVISKSDCHVNATVDLAVSDKDSSDYTVIIVYAVTLDYKVLVLDIYREKLSGSEQVRLIDGMIAKWNPQVTGIESVQYQAAFIDQMRSRGLNIKSLKATKGKTFRAQGINTRLQSGNVFFRANASWLIEFEKELIEFPKSDYDDQVDAFAYIDSMMRKGMLKDAVGAGRKILLTDNWTLFD